MPDFPIFLPMPRLDHFVEEPCVGTNRNCRGPSKLKLNRFWTLYFVINCIGTNFLILITFSQFLELMPDIPIFYPSPTGGPPYLKAPFSDQPIILLDHLKWNYPFFFSIFGQTNEQTNVKKNHLFFCCFLFMRGGFSYWLGDGELKIGSRNPCTCMYVHVIQWV